MPRQADDYIPEFMYSKEYEQHRQERLRQIETEEEWLRLEAERRRRYKLQKQAEAKRARQIKRRNKIIVRIIIGGIVVTVLGNMFVNSLTNKGTVDVDNPYEVSIVEDEKGKDQEDMYTVSINPTVPSVSAPEDVDVINIELSYEARKASIDTSGKFEVGSEVNEYFFLVLNDNQHTYELFMKYGEMYGVDPYILMAKAFL